jgi:hypothetical protein
MFIGHEQNNESQHKRSGSLLLHGPTNLRLQVNLPALNRAPRF